MTKWTTEREKEEEGRVNGKQSEEVLRNVTEKNLT